MCGIIGYIGHRSAAEVVLEGLRRLEYRGYDSAGLAVWNAGGVHLRRAAGKLSNLEARVRLEPVHGTVGIGHTRWATHGRPTEANAHPHADCAGTLVVVHNGIIENHLALRDRLAADGHQFRSETDTEVVAHLVEARLAAGEALLDAVRHAGGELRGAYALAVLSATAPDELVVATHGGGPAVIGLGESEAYVASDIPAMLAHTRDVIILEDGDVARITRGEVDVVSSDGRRGRRAPARISWKVAQAQKGAYSTFMRKEIHEQPRAVRETFQSLVEATTGDVVLPDWSLDADLAQRLRRVVLVACGTSYHAAMIGRHTIERLAGLPAEVDIASEFRYRDTILGPDTLVIGLSQSGETADTLGAIRMSRDRRAVTVGITNVAGSAMSREASGVVYTCAGPEIGVASSKTFTTTVVACHLLGLALGRARGYLAEADVRKHLDGLRELPAAIGSALALEPEVAVVARAYSEAASFLYLGRGLHHAVALEGALKLKELAYVHAEGYAAGEMKHGPIALIDESLPVVALAPRDGSYDRMLGNVQEVRARGGRIIVIGHPDDVQVAQLADHVLAVPAVPDLLAPLVSVVPLQFLAYEIAVLRGLDVDQPRNLAKSVTVE